MKYALKKDSSAKGRLFWFTGLSGAGKTTIGREFLLLLKDRGNSPVFLDGDEMRAVFGDGISYSKEDRRLLANRYSRLCKLLTDQGLDVVCCTISMFHSVRQWNKENIGLYFEIYVKAPMDALLSRNAKGIYGKDAESKASDVVGVDIQMEEPLNPNFIALNDGKEPPEEIARRIALKFGLVNALE